MYRVYYNDIIILIYIFYIIFAIVSIITQTNVSMQTPNKDGQAHALIRGRQYECIVSTI